ncbi:LemA protein [Sphingomonas sp. UYAg733]
MPHELIVAIVIVALLIAIIVLIYNSLVRSHMRVKTGWAQIDTQLKRRHDLVPNLVAAVRGYMGHESAVLEKVAAVREQAVQAGSDVARRSSAEGALSGALGQLIARVEAMPDLKADSTVMALQEELATTENRIAFARQHYNETVGRYNGAIATIPANLIAGPCGFAAEKFFELDGPVTVPVVDLGR